MNPTVLLLPQRVVGGGGGGALELYQELWLLDKPAPSGGVC